MTPETFSLPKIVFLGTQEEDSDEYLPQAIAEHSVRADLYQRMGDLDRALSEKHQAVAVAVSLKRPTWLRGQLVGLGCLHGARQEHERAIAVFRRALAVPYGDDVPRQQRLMEEAVLLCGLGKSQLKVEPSAAIETFLASRARYRELGDAQWVYMMTGHLGEAYARNRRHKEAIACYEEVLPTVRAEGPPEQLLVVLNVLAGLYTGIRDMKQAMDYAEQVRALAVELGDDQAEREALTLQGLQYAHVEDPAGARSHHERALHLARLQGDGATVITSLIDLSTAQIKLNDARGAIRTLRELLPLLKQDGQEKNLRISECNLGQALAQTGEYAEALPYLQKSWDWLRATGQTTIATSLGVDLGTAYVFTRRPKEAITVLEGVRQELVKQRQDLVGEGRDSREGSDGRDGWMKATLSRLGEAHAACKDFASAQAVWEELLALTRKNGDPRELLLALHQTAGALFYQRRWRQSLRLSEEELLVARQIDDEGAIASALYSVGVVHGELGNLPKATELLQTALSMWAEQGSPDVEMAREALQAWKTSS